MSRLVVLVGFVVLLENTLYTALAPLLPDLERDLGLGKPGSGVLVGAYAVGTIAGALPGGWLAARHGAKPILLAGLALLVTGGIGFAWGTSAVVLDAARGVQGVGGALTWIASMVWLAEAVPAERRGEAFGYAIGAAVVGGQAGPLLGVAADATSRSLVFTAFSALGVVLVAWTLREPRGRPLASGGAARGLARDAHVLAACWFFVGPAIVLGITEVLLPLRLDELGWGSVAIGGVFLAAAVAVAAWAPVSGRIGDRRGPVVVVRAGLAAGACGAALLAVAGAPGLLAVIWVLTGIGLGSVWAPADHHISMRSERLGIDQAWAFAAVNLAFGLGVLVGALGGGGLGQAVGDWLPYALGAVLLAGSVLVAGRLREAPGEPPAAPVVPVPASVTRS